MREIVLDTETTGLSPRDGHRIIEIGCLAINNFVPTGEVFHTYIYPERNVPEEASRIHGITDDFLQGKPIFSEVADGFLEFLGDSRLVIHNARFDISFINAEFGRLGISPLAESRAIDTVSLARSKFPGSPASLDALCRRFGIDTSARDFHGALLDARLLADVYLELNGGRQRGLDIAASVSKNDSIMQQAKLDDKNNSKYLNRKPRFITPTEDQIKAHETFIDTLTNALWRKKA